MGFGKAGSLKEYKSKSKAFSKVSEAYYTSKPKTSARDIIWIRGIKRKLYTVVKRGLSLFEDSIYRLMNYSIYLRFYCDFLLLFLCVWFPFVIKHLFPKQHYCNLFHICHRKVNSKIKNSILFKRVEYRLKSSPQMGYFSPNQISMSQTEIIIYWNPT